MDIEKILKMDSASWEVLSELQQGVKTREKDLVKVNRIQEQIKLFRDKLNKTQTQLSKVSAEIKVKQQCLNNQRKRKRQVKNTDKYSKKSVKYSVWKNPKNFENVLEKKTTQFSFGQSKNRDRRKHIDELRREKMMRERINHNLELEIEGIKGDISNLGRVVQGLENRQNERKMELIQEKKRSEDKSEIAKLGIKHVAERLQEENERTKIDFFQGVTNWGIMNPSGLGGSTIYNSANKEKKIKKQFFDEQVNMEERKRLIGIKKNLEDVLQMWFDSTNSNNTTDLKNYIKKTTEENTVNLINNLIKSCYTNKPKPCSKNWKN